MLLILLLSAALQAVQQTPTAVIEGTVVDAATGEALRDVQLYLRAGGFTAETLSNERGGFSFDGLNAGRYQLTATRTGYLSQIYLQARVDIPVAPDLVVTAGRRYPVSFKLIRAAVVAGRIYDAERQPAAKAEIQLLSIGYDGFGRRTLTQVGNLRPVQSDAEGNYRITGVQPGDFYVRAAYGALPARPTAGTVAVNANHIAATYYPGVSNPDEASAIKVLGGANLQAIDLSLVAVSQLKVSGRIVNPFLKDGMPSYDFFLVPRNLRLREEARAVPNQSSATDQFELHNIPRGSYDLYIGYHLGPRPDDGILTGRISFDVVDRDITELTATIDAGVDLTGEITLDEAAAAMKPDLTQFQPLLVSYGGVPVSFAPTAMVGRRPFVQKDGTFRIPHAATGKYFLLMSLPGPAARALYVAAARIGTQDILGRPFDIDSDSTGPLVIELSGAGGRMDGVVTDRDNAPVPGAQIVLVPPINFREDRIAYKTATSDDRGGFSIIGIRPGTYTAFAFAQRLNENEIRNSEVMTPYLASGMPVEILKSQTARRDLKIIP